MSDWMARPSGRFLIWWLLILAGGGLGLTIVGVGWGVTYGIKWLTGSETVANVIGMLFLITFVAGVNAWIWTASGNRYVQAFTRMMTRMEGRRP